MLEKAFQVVESLADQKFILIVERNNIELNEFGSDWTPVLSSLVQIICEKELRTVSGLCDLIEREWVQAGYFEKKINKTVVIFYF